MNEKINWSNEATRTGDQGTPSHVPYPYKLYSPRLYKLNQVVVQRGKDLKSWCRDFLDHRFEPPHCSN